MDPDEFEAVELERPPHGLRGLPTGQRNPELLVFVCGGDELVRVGLDADGDADLHLLPPAERLRDVGDPHDLLEGVEHDTADAGLDGTVDLVGGLVVAVEGDAVGGHTGGQGGRELAARADVEVEPFLVQPAHDGPGQERLPRVEHVGVLPERRAPGARPRPEVRLVDEVRRRAEFLRERLHIDPPTLTTPSSVRVTVCAHTFGSSVFRSAGGAA